MERDADKKDGQGRLVLVGFVPHPPVMVPEVGRGQERQVEKTIQAMQRLGKETAAAEPETLIVITPHGPVFQDAFAMAGGEELRGNLWQFGAAGVAMRYPNDPALLHLIAEEAAKEGITAVVMDEKLARRFSVPVSLDHGVLVPLYFLRQGGVLSPQEAAKAPGKSVGVRLVSIAYGFLPYDEVYAFGIALQRAVRRSGKRVALIASGDLSHRLTPDAPAGYHPEGAAFDRRVCELTAAGDVEGFFQFTPRQVEKAGECGLRSFLVGWGAADGCQISPQVYSYEGPFGVGYMVANLGVGEEDPGRRLLERLREGHRQILKARRENEPFPVRLARQTVESFVKEGKRPSLPAEVPEEFERAAGVFVSIKKKGQLRGCIGTVYPMRGSVAEEIIENAISAAVRDPRFPPVAPEELEDLEYSVDVLGDPEPVSGLEELDPVRYGVIVSSGQRRGLLLPDLEGVETAEEQVSIARRKAGISENEPVTLERFEVKRFK